MSRWTGVPLIVGRAKGDEVRSSKCCTPVRQPWRWPGQGKPSGR